MFRKRRPIRRQDQGGRQRLYVALIAGILLTLVSLLVKHEGSAAPDVDLPWETPKRLSTNADNGAFRPVMRQAPDGTLIVAYEHKTPGDLRNPYFTRSSDNGKTWSTPAPIRTANDNLRHVTLAFDDNSNAHAVWRNSSGLAHAAESQWPSGETTIVSTADVLLDPHLAIGGDGVLHLVWAQTQGAQGLHDTFHAYSLDGGATWSAPANLTSNDVQHSSVPVVVVDANNNAHAFWDERILDLSQPGTFRYEIHYKKGTKTGNGYAWQSTATVVSGSLPTARRPAATADGNDLHVSFARQVANEEQYPYYRRFTPESGWSAALDASKGNPVSVNTNSPFYLITSVSACSSSAFVYYHGSEETNAKEQIFGVSNYDNWNVVDAVTTSDLRNINPTLICRGASLFLTMERVEVANVNHQIYFTASHNINSVYLPIVAQR